MVIIIFLCLLGVSSKRHLKYVSDMSMSATSAIESNVSQATDVGYELENHIAQPQLQLLGTRKRFYIKGLNPADAVRKTSIVVPYVSTLSRLHELRLGSVAAARKRSRLVPFDTVWYVNIVKTFGVGLSADSVCLADLMKDGQSIESMIEGGDAIQMRIVLKLFLKQGDAENEVKAINNMNILGLGEFFPKHVFSGQISSKSRAQLARNKNALVATEFENVYAVQDFLVTTCTASVSEAIVAITRQLGLELPHDPPQVLQVVADLVFQIFYIIYIMKTRGPFNHCDMHMHNLLISVGPPQNPLIVEFGDTCYHLKEPSGIRLKVIDLDTMTEVKQKVGLHKLCMTTKAYWSGTRKVLTKSNSLLKSCKSKNAMSDPIAEKLAKGNPLTPQVEGVLDPVDGDMYHFRWMVEVLNDKLDLGIEMKSLAKIIDDFSERRLPYYKTERLIEHYKKHLEQLYHIVFAGKLSEYVWTNGGHTKAKAIT